VDARISSEFGTFWGRHICVTILWVPNVRFLPRVVLDYSYYSYSSGINSVSIVSPATGLETKQSSFKPCVLGHDLALVVGELIRTSPGITYMYVEASGFPRHHHPDIFKLKAASHPMAYTDKVV